MLREWRSVKGTREGERDIPRFRSRMEDTSDSEVASSISSRSSIISIKRVGSVRDSASPTSIPWSDNYMFPLRQFSPLGKRGGRDENEPGILHEPNHRIKSYKPHSLLYSKLLPISPSPLSPLLPHPHQNINPDELSVVISKSSLSNSLDLLRM